MTVKLIYKIVIFFFIFTNYSLAVNFEGKFEQGGFILGKTAPNSKVKIGNKNNERNSLVKPLENEISPEAISTMIINQSAKFKPKAST